MKKACFSAGESDGKLVEPGVLKFRSTGAGVAVGSELSRKAPTSAFAGQDAPDIPLFAGVAATTPPSGGLPDGPGTKFTLPDTVKVTVDPGTRVMPVTSTGDCPGTESPPQQVLPLGIPERYGLEVPGTDGMTTCAKTGAPSEVARIAAAHFSQEVLLPRRPKADQSDVAPILSPRRS